MTRNMELGDRNAKVAPTKRARVKRKRFARWSEHLDVLLYDGRCHGLSAARMADLLNRARVVLPRGR